MTSLLRGYYPMKTSRVRLWVKPLHQAAEAAVEFQKFHDHRGIALNSPLAALARLQLGRAYLLAGDKTKARHAYLEFLELWKDADPNIPVLKHAKVECAKAQ
jgi:eukaryotic-like serine/threonine-protein kinase